MHGPGIHNKQRRKSNKQPAIKKTVKKQEPKNPKTHLRQTQHFPKTLIIHNKLHP